MAHAEFAGRIWRNAGEIPGNGIDDDHNGFIDDVQGWDFVDNDNNPEDSLGHGTSVASIIGANGNNGVGFAGVDWRCKLMIVRVIDSVGTEIMLAQGVGYAVQNGARVLNISLAFASASQLVAAAIDTARAHGAVVCAGTGNDGTEGVKFPANMDAVVAVGATNPDDTRCAPFFNGGGSNYGIAIDVVAPGNHIAALGISASTEYSQRLAGTSYSTALVSGLAALLLAQNPARTPVQIANIICWTADDQVGNPTEDTPGWDKYYGFGRINARAALAYNAGAVRPVTRGNAGGRGAAFRVRYTPGDGVTVVPAAGVAVVGMYSLLGRAVPLVSRVRDGGARVRAASAGGVWLVSTERAGRKEATPALLTP
jgi:subtilisin family serine protease